MISKYFKAVPTLIVLGVTGYTTSPILFREADPAPPKGTTQPPAATNLAIAADSDFLRSPFQVSQPRLETKAVNGVAAAVGTTSIAAPNQAPGATTKPAAGLSASNHEPPEVPAESDETLATMKLVGTLIDKKQRLAVIDGQIYAQGDALKDADGKALPYIVQEVHPYKTLIRRGKRNFTLAFSDKPTTTAESGETATKARRGGTSDKVAATKPAPRSKSNPSTKAKSSTRPATGPSTNDESTLAALGKLAGTAPQAGNSGSASASSSAANDAKSSIMSLLSGPSGLLPGGSATSNALSTGLDALMGKYDNIGNGVATPNGGAP